MNRAGINDVYKPTCSDPTIGRWINDFDVADLLSALALEDGDFAGAFPDVALFSKQQRLALFTDIGEHLAACEYCSRKRNNDLEFDSRLNAALRADRHIVQDLKANRSGVLEPYSPHLFLCHSSADKKFVEKLALDLSELDVRVWFDTWELKAGDSIHGCIEVALSTSAFVGIVISPDSMKSRWCKEELNAALAREIQTGSKVVLPLLYRSVALPAFLADRLYLDFRRRRLPALAELAAFIHDLDRRELAVLLSRGRLRSFADLQNLLRRLGWRTTKRVFVPSKEFRMLIHKLRQAGVEITGDEFDLLQRRPPYLRTTVVE
jgi:hypothetical protein